MTRMMTLAESLAMVPGAVLVGDGARAFERVHTDTRTLRAGDLFVALKGERFDAHDFLPQARAAGAGAVAAIGTHGVAEAGLDGLVVPDPLQALQALATGWRRRFAGPVIAVTGSNGKTTVTQMVASILRAAHADAAHATAGNLNNHIGVPLTVLRMDASHKSAVIELGMNHPGEIAVLARIAQPTVALVNNAQREHQEFMGTVEAVARENGSAIEALPADGVAVFPCDDEYADIWQAQAAGRRCLRFALAGEADGPWPRAEISARARWAGDAWQVEMTTPEGQARLTLRVAGRHNVRNALASTAAALGAGIALADVVRGLESFAPVKGRSQLKSLRRGGRTLPLVDDTYNANPDSVRAAIDVLAGLPAPRWLLLGDMGEVGDQGPAFHQEIGAYAQARGIDAFWCAGGLCAHAARAYGPEARHFSDTPALLAALGDSPAGEPAFASVLAKGSRFMGMERVVALLQAHDDGGGHAA